MPAFYIYKYSRHFEPDTWVFYPPRMQIWNIYFKAFLSNNAISNCRILEAWSPRWVWFYAGGSFWALQLQLLHLHSDTSASISSVLVIVWIKLNLTECHEVRQAHLASIACYYGGTSCMLSQRFLLQYHQPLCAENKETSFKDPDIICSRFVGLCSGPAWETSSHWHLTVDQHMHILISSPQLVCWSFPKMVSQPYWSTLTD